MPRRFISQELKEFALASSLRGASNASIEEFYRIKESTMRRLRQTYCQTGDVVRAPVFSGRPCLMDGLNTNVCHFALIFCLMANGSSFSRAAYCGSQTWIFRSSRHTFSKLVGFRPQLQQFGGLWSASDTQWRWYIFLFLSVLSPTHDMQITQPAIEQNEDERTTLLRP